MQSGQYIQLGKLVVVQAHVQFGTSGTGAGSGTYRVSLPVNLSASPTFRRFGNVAEVFDSSGGSRTFPQVQQDGTNVGYVVFMQSLTTGVVTHASPFAWAASDALVFTLVYQSA